VVAFTPSGLQTDVDADEIDADSEVIDVSPDAKVEAEPSKEVDPLADIRAQLGGAARRDELESLRNQVRSELGRSQRLEARLEAMAGANPLADVDPRLDANEALLTSISDALIDSELTDDRMKSALRASRSALDAAKGVRAQGRMREELKADILKALPKVEEPVQTLDPWAQATADVVADLKGLLPDFDPTTIPATVWNAGKAKGTPARAAVYVIRWAEQQAANPAAERIAVRRQAAGDGSPARSGASPSVTDMSDADAAYGSGAINHEQYVAYRKQFNLSLEPGGGR